MALEALSDGGVKMGLTREAASRLAAQTMIVSVAAGTRLAMSFAYSISI